MSRAGLGGPNLWLHKALSSITEPQRIRLPFIYLCVVGKSRCLCWKLELTGLKPKRSRGWRTLNPSFATSRCRNRSYNLDQADVHGVGHRPPAISTSSIIASDYANLYVSSFTVARSYRKSIHFILGNIRSSNYWPLKAGLHRFHIFLCGYICGRLSK